MDKFLKYIRVYLCPSVVQMRFLKEQTKKIKILSLEAAEGRKYCYFRIILCIFQGIYFRATNVLWIFREDTFDKIYFFLFFFLTLVRNYVLICLVIGRLAQMV